jgi:60s Acidic ribosomal protein
LSNVGSGGGAPAAGSAVAVASGAEAVVEEKKEEVPEEKEESDDDMVRTLFDFQRLQVLLMFFFTLFRVLDFSINLLYYISWRICYLTCPM